MCWNRVRLGMAAAALCAGAATLAPTLPALAAPATICVTAACVNASQPIYYGSADVTGQRIFRIPNTGGSPVQVTTMTDFIIAFSHDLGHSLAVLTRNRTRDTVIQMNTDGTGANAVAAAPSGRFLGVALNPSGTVLAVAELNRIETVTPQGLQPLATINGAVAVRDLDWSSDGHQIAFSYIDDARSYATFIGRVDLQTGQVVLSGRLGWSPSWSPDGTRIAHVGGDGVSGPGITIMRINPPQNAFISIRSLSLVSWSPDGTSLAYVGRRDSDGEAQLHRMRIDGTADTVLATSYKIGLKLDWGYAVPAPVASG